MCSYYGRLSSYVLDVQFETLYCFEIKKLENKIISK